MGLSYLLELQLRRLRAWYWQLSATTYHTQLLQGCCPSQRTFRRLHSMQDLFIFTCLSDRIIVNGGVENDEEIVLAHEMAHEMGHIDACKQNSPHLKGFPTN